MIVLAVALAGGMGAALRFVVDGAVARLHERPVPLGTILINVTGSFALGLLVALARNHAGLEGLVTVLGTGLLGGYTSFSTASVEAVMIALQDGPRAAISAGAHAAVMLLVSMAAAGLGLWLG